MAAVVSQLIVALSVLFSIAGSSDVIRVVGDSVQLEINGSVSEFDDFTWTFNGSVNVLKYYKENKGIKPSSHYKDRVEFIEETCSLILKNLQKTDSGLYDVKASNAENITTATYRLSVLDPVKAPVLTYTRSLKLCNITLTCRGHDLSINSSCNKETCEEKNVTSPGGVALSLSVRNSIIICNHSNLVSWKNKTLTHLCDDIETSNDPSVLYRLVILPAVGLLVFLFVGYRWIKQRRSEPSSPEARLETDSARYSSENPQHPASNGASGYNTGIQEPVPASVPVETSKPETLYSVDKKSN